MNIVSIFIFLEKTNNVILIETTVNSSGHLLLLQNI